MVYVLYFQLQKYSNTGKQASIYLLLTLKNLFFINLSETKLGRPLEAWYPCLALVLRPAAAPAGLAGYRRTRGYGLAWRVFGSFFCLSCHKIQIQIRQKNTPKAPKRAELLVL
jgi:hypothetical protein